MNNCWCNVFSQCYWVSLSCLLDKFCLVSRQLLLCRVVLGKSFLQFSAMKMAHAPPGHHSIIGRPSSGGLTFAEYVVYRGEQVSLYYWVLYLFLRCFDMWVRYCNY